MAKNWIGKTIIALVVIGLLIAGGFAAYRIGYVQGFSAATNGGGGLLWAERFENMPHGGYFDNSDSYWMPHNRYPGSRMDGFSRTPFGGSVLGHGSFFSPFSFLFRIAFWGFVIWLVYKLVTGFKSGQGWKLSFTREPVAEDTRKEKEAYFLSVVRALPFYKAGLFCFNQRVIKYLSLNEGW